jgi:hypothetical protein
MEHSKLPWELGGRVSDVVADLEDQHNIYPPLGEAGPIAEVAGRANAAFICLCCNSHEALMDALKDARYALYGDGPGNPKIDAAIKAGEVKG